MKPREDLIAAARTAAENAYAPYSKFRVGAAVLCADGTVFSGANVENRSFGLTMCAERVAIGAAVSAGYREFRALAVAGIDSEHPLPPCGACRQVLAEFLSPGVSVAYTGRDGCVAQRTIGELLPEDSLHGLLQDE